MKKLLGSLLAFVALGSAPAFAGVGSTAYLQSMNDGTTWYPSLDIHTEGWLVQIHLLDVLSVAGPTKDINFGADVTKVALKRKVGNDIDGVIAPGVGFRLDAPTSFKNAGFNAVLQARMGAEVKQGMGIGLYVVPELGISNLASVSATGKRQIGVTYGGGLQVSVWTKKL
jgi:hypothetical protein